MGVLLPWVNAKVNAKIQCKNDKMIKEYIIRYDIIFLYKIQGALIGGLSGLGFMGWISLSAEAAIASGRIK